MFILYLLLSVGGMVLVKSGGGFNIGISDKSLCFNVSFASAAGALMYILSFILWLMLLKNHELSRIFPIAAASTAAITVIYGIIAGESVTPMRIAGIILVIAGVAIIR